MSDNPLPIYALAKLQSAIEILATHPGEIRDRLRAAGPDLMAVPHSIAGASNVNEDIQWIYSALTQKGNVSASLHRMRNKHAVCIAERVLLAHTKIHDYISHDNDTN